MIWFSCWVRIERQLIAFPLPNSGSNLGSVRLRHRMRELDGQSRLPHPTRTDERDQPRGRVCEPAAQRFHLALPPDQGGRCQRQCGMPQFVCRLPGWCTRTGHETIAAGTRQIQGRRQRPHGLGMRAPPLAALQRAHAVNRQPGDTGSVIPLPF